MNGLEDLVRETLAARAHDVDGLTFSAPATEPRPARRWVAVGTVAAVAAAIIVAVVLVAPWRSTPQRHATQAAVPSPPAGMQWVSYHGITLTVPESWSVSYAECVPRDGDVVDLGGVPTTSCPYAGRAPQTTTVSFGPITDDTPRGEATTIAGHPALRTESIAESSPLQVTAIAQLTEVGVALTVSTSSPQRVDVVLGGIEYTPIDHYGCTAQLSPQDAAWRSSATVRLGDEATGYVCEYASGSGSDAWLIGSRELTTADIGRLRELADSGRTFEALTQPLVVAPGFGVHLYRLTSPEGTTTSIAADPRNGSVVLSTGGHAVYVPGGESEVFRLPSAYR